MLVWSSNAHHMDRGILNIKINILKIKKNSFFRERILKRAYLKA